MSDRAALLWLTALAVLAVLSALLSHPEVLHGL